MGEINRGFTLVELMVTIAVLAILLTIAAPAFSDLIMNNRLATATNEVQNALGYAKSEAGFRRQFVTVCTSSDGSSCATSGNWQNGLLVFTDRGTVGVVDGSDQILKYIQFTGSGLLISSGDSTDFDSNRYIRFRPRGGVASRGSLKFCDTRTGNYGRQLTISPIGRIESSKQLSCP
jgi:type IV fimbrial biogenesis protein FimT